jgi:uncharacterized membrane protein
MKYLITIIAVVIAIFVSIWIAGNLLPVTHSVTLSKTYNTSQDKIYQLITNVNKFPSWRSNVKDVEVLNDKQKPLEWREYYTDNDPLTFRILNIEDSTLIVTEIADTNLPFGGGWTYQIAEENNSTKLTITENGEVYNPFFRFVSKYIIGHEATIKQFLSDLEDKTKKG